MSVFTEINEAVNIEEVAIYYDILVKNHKALCPFHNDSHPSMSFKYNRYKCWTCDAHGSAIDLVMNLFDLSVKDAASRLNDDFKLGFNMRGKQSAVLVRKRQSEKHLQDNFNQWVIDTTATLSEYFRRLNAQIKKCKLDEPIKGLTDLYADTVKKADYVEYLLDVLGSDDIDNKLEIFKQYRKRVMEIAKENEQCRKDNGELVE